MEIWKDIEGYKGYYQISNLGNIKSLPRKVKGRGDIILDVEGCIRIPRIGKAGYCYVNLKMNGSSKTFKNHRLVAQYFVSGFKEGLVVNHKDGNKLNNHYSNLEWVTLSQNSKHAIDNNLYQNVKGFQHGRKKTNNAHVLIMRSLKKIGLTYKEISESFNLSKGHVREIIKCRKWKHI